MKDTCSTVSVTTLASIKQDRADATARAEAVAKAQQRTVYLSQLADLQPRIEKRLEEIKETKRELKAVSAGIKAVETDEAVSNQDLGQLVIDAQTALNVADPFGFLADLAGRRWHGGGVVNTIDHRPAELVVGDLVFSKR